MNFMCPRGEVFLRSSGKGDSSQGVWQGKARDRRVKTIVREAMLVHRMWSKASFCDRHYGRDPQKMLVYLTMNDVELQDFAGRYRDILRQAVFLIRSFDAEGELSTGQVSILNMIATQPQRVGVIARNCGIRVPSATEQIIKLESLGLVERIPDDSDARVVLVRLCEAGRNSLDEANAQRNVKMAEALKTLSANERLAIARALPAIAKLNNALAG